MSISRGLFLPAVWALLSAAALAAESLPAEQEQRFRQFELQMRAQDYDAAEKHLTEWAGKSREDIELAVARANLHVALAQRSALLTSLPQTSAGQELKVEKDAFVLYDTETSQAAGLLDLSPRYDDESLTRAATILAEAATSHPERLDVRFGLAFIVQTAGDNDRLCDVLRQAAGYASAHPDKLRWRFGASLPESAATFVPESLHGYARQASEAETPAGDETLRRIAEIAVEFYPGHPYGYNDLAVYHSIRREDDKALEYLLKAHKAAPKDPLVTINIAVAYQKNKDLARAREFYGKTRDLAEDAALKAEAEAALEGLKEP